MENILVIGGTGMLSKATKWLNDEGHSLTLVARNAEKLERVSSSCRYPENNRIISLSYEDSDRLRACIQEEQKNHGNYTMVIAWIHSTAPDALGIIIDEIIKFQQPFKLFHVLGSSSDLQKIQRSLKVPNECDYRQIQLGFIIENNRSRWLTNDEISNGVIHAIINDNPVTVVGTLQPWSMRP
jgi:hypothetical protein